MVESNAIANQKLSDRTPGNSATESFQADDLDFHAGSKPSPKVWKQRAFIWGLSSTVLSVVGLVALALFEQYNSMLAELRNDLKHFNETSAEYAKRDQLQRCREMMKDLYKEVTTSNGTRAVLEQELRTSEHGREELVKEVQRLRERVAYVEGLQSVKTSLP